jgi:hypothetical protein
MIRPKGSPTQHDLQGSAFFIAFSFVFTRKKGLHPVSVSGRMKRLVLLTQKGTATG